MLGLYSTQLIFRVGFRKYASLLQGFCAAFQTEAAYSFWQDSVHDFRVSIRAS